MTEPIGVYKAINKVQKELAISGISKDRTNTQGSGYKFRGIDDVYNAISPLMAEHGLCILPRMLKREITERASQKGNALFYVVVEAEFDFVSASDGSKHTVKTFGEAMDSGDKATNKAMSAAYKYAAFQAFAIPTEGENDADAATHTVKPAMIHKPTDGAWEAMDNESQEYLQSVADNVMDINGHSGIAAAYDHLEAQILTSEEKIALWTRLDSKIRAAIKKEGESRKKAA